MEAVKQTNKVHKATAASHSTGKRAMSGSFAPDRVAAVPFYIQTKLSVNKPSDKYEREADSVADKVMRMSSTESKPTSFLGEKNQGIQRQSQAGNLTVNKPNVAIKAFSPTMITRKFNQGQENIQRKENKPILEYKSHEDTQLLETELKSTKGSGQPLSPQTNAFMSKAMGADFSQVHIHTDAKAVAMNRAVHAHAFTHGKDIYFNTGKYDPDSASGKHLLAHELTHVVQQGGGTSKIQKHEDSNKIQRKTKRSLSSDTAFQSVLTKVKQTAQKVKKHEPVSKKVKEAQMAAKPPKNEKASKAKGTKVAEMAQQEPGVFNEAKFKEALKAKIAALQLNSLKEADEFKKNKGGEAIKGDMASQVSNEKTSAVGDIDKKTKEEPNTNKETGKEVGSEPTKENNISAPAISGQQAAPKPVDAEDISLQKESQSLDAQMSEAKVTDTQLSKSNEPKFNNALTNKKAAQEDAIKRPQEFRKDEKGIISQAQMIASGTSKNHLGAMVGNRKKQTGNVLSKQQLAKIKDEQDRAKIAADIELKFTTTKTDVETILSNLDKDVNSIFDKGIADATQSFQNYVDAKMDAYKDERYDGISGAAQWLIDKFKGLPDEVNRFYKEGKDLYTSIMDVVINQVAKLVAKQLNEAKKRISAGKKEIKDYVASLPKNLQKIGADAAKDIQSKFSELESSVDSKQSELVDSLAAKYKAGMDNIDTKISEMKEANKGLISKAIGAIKDVIDTIIAFKNMLLDVLARAAAAIQLIIDDPIGFLGNLVAGVKLGIQNFVGNILTHLKAGLMGWLFGTLASAGIDVPKTFDFKGILSLILQVLGLTYANIRSRAVNIVGEKVVAGLEKAAEIFIIIKNEGIGGLWRFIKEKVEDLKETVINSIKEFVVTKIITAGVTWLISMLNPASAFIKACKMIYDVIMFFINRGKQIMALVNAVIDSVTAIAKGNISVAASFVENALAKAIPVAIGFLASLLGLDGISEKIKAIIQKIQEPINKAIDWVINKAVSLVKGVAGIAGKLKDKVLGLLGIKKSFSDKDGEKHTLYFNGDESDAELMIASTPKLVTAFLNDLMKTEDGKKVAGEIRSKLKEINKLKLKITSQTDVAENKATHTSIKTLVDELGVLLSSISIEGKSKKMKLKTLTFTNIYENMGGEYKRQLGEQQTAMNGMKIVKWLSNRHSFEKAGRIDDGTLRKQVNTKNDDYDKFVKEQKAKGVSAAESKKIWEYRLAATHRLDQVAGGDHDNFSNVGVYSVNSHIGTQWKDKVEDLVNAVKEVNPEQYNEANMNVKLIVN